MCGIAVIVGSEGQEALARRMTRSMGHRGPDDEGIDVQKVDGSANWVSLGHRRLSILDLSPLGHQPMRDGVADITITFNGEIYNFVELREQLASLGYEFRSGSDTEVLLAAYREWGEKMFARLEGMFAFAILDRPRGRMIAARDPFGIKPLYWTRWERGIGFASEIKALLELPGVSRKVATQGVYDYLRFGLTDRDESTLLQNVHRLPPATYVSFPLGTKVLPEPVHYWRPRTETRKISFNQAKEELRELFLDSVRLQLRSDVPVGSALSGGIDSSSIVMAMRKLEPQADIHCFSYIAADASLSEENWVDLVVDKAKVHVHKTRPEAAEMRRDLEQLIRFQEEPFATTSIYAQYRVFRAAAEAGIKVTLDGQGADELLAGYPVYRGARVASLLKSGRWNRIPALLQSPRTVLQASQFLIPAGWQGPFRSLVGQPLVPEWLDESWLRDRGVRFITPRGRYGKDVLKEELVSTLTETNLPMLLRYADRNSMSHSIESRVPFLSTKLADFLLALPEDYLISPTGVSKYVFREAMRGIVPDAVLDRRDKIGFVTPERSWLREMGGWISEVLADARPEQVPAVKLATLRQQWEKERTSNRGFDSRFWRSLNLLLWSKNFEVQFA